MVKTLKTFKNILKHFLNKYFFSVISVTALNRLVDTEYFFLNNCCRFGSIINGCFLASEKTCATGSAVIIPVTSVKL